MSKECIKRCFAYALCNDRASEQPVDYSHTFQQMMGSGDRHTGEQIVAAADLMKYADLCTSFAPEVPEHCRIIAAATIKSVIG